MQFLVEYEETLLVATARAGKQVQLFIRMCRIVSFPGAELEESFKDFGKNREAMRLCREGECFSSRAKGVFWFWGFGHTRTHGLKHFKREVKRSAKCKLAVNNAHLEFPGQPDIICETFMLVVW